MIKGQRQDTEPGAADRLPEQPEEVVAKVRERYGKIAEGQATGCGTTAPSGCCGSVEQVVASQIGYRDEDLEAVPGDANLGLGCGAPVAHLRLQPGEVLVDLGSGGGLDAFLAARDVGPTGRVIGVDMTPEMIERATQAARNAGLDQVEFRQGRLESLPVEDASVDAVTSNCVINLVPDKSAVFREVARVLKPGGRLVVSDIVLDGPLPDALRRDLLAYVGCVAGAMQRETYFGGIRDAGLHDVEILKDVDYLAAVADTLPDEVVELMKRTGVRLEDVKGVVRSVTFRAVKP
jgi:SAM-dependent methyltransferase